MRAVFVSMCVVHVCDVYVHYACVYAFLLYIRTLSVRTPRLIQMCRQLDSVVDLFESVDIRDLNKWVDKERTTSKSDEVVRSVFCLCVCCLNCVHCVVCHIYVGVCVCAVCMSVCY